ncbi:hypothetical protein LEN26_016040 [Aphanomyces euteiches]|nr:hypothetical protein LEN26_016040 [Aphanomyces euteiches]KAH9116613.1 hypothetical protein AeMF1_009465 [Aphanomyces euteiches]KAH9182942.1 hypothetical protein AeNC1_015081 [Aphanomyces euteiches]
MAIRKLKARGIGRLELLNWLNEFLETDYTKIEHLADGIAYCQVFDVLYPGKVPLQNVNFHAQYEPECERNLKILQKTFETCGIQKEVAIKKLVKGVFQEHFEFLHWVHDYVHRTYPDAVRTSHAFERRERLVQKAADGTFANLNLIPKFSMRNGIYRKSLNQVLLQQDDVSEHPPSIEAQNEPQHASPPEAIESADHAVKAQATPQFGHSWQHTIEAKGIATKAFNSMQGTTTDVKPRKTKVQVRPEKAKSHKATEGLLKQLTTPLEAELHGRIQDLDNLQVEVSALLTERKYYSDILREIEHLCQQVDDQDDTANTAKAVVLGILAEPLKELPFDRQL